MDPASPATSPTLRSTPASLCTARGSPSNAADDTAMSSPVDDPPPDIPDPVGRDARPLPRELRSHCQILLEEKLYSDAIQMLSGFLGDGLRPDPAALATRPKRRPRKLQPALVPPPGQLALVATLAIHPSFTSLAPDAADLHTAAHALAYLRGLVGTVGPVHANLGAAFSFSARAGGLGGGGGARSTRSGGGGLGGGFGSGLGGGGGEDSDDAPASRFARDQLVFRRGRDFWSVLGWAFRCAAEHPHRWRHWRVWLDLMVGVLEADLDERLARDQAASSSSSSSSSSYPMLRESLVARYLEDLRRDGRPVLKEVMRALLAFLDPENQASDRALYREVFENETRRTRGKRKREDDLPLVDLEKDRFGDYLDDDEDVWSEDDAKEEGDGAASLPSAAAATATTPSPPQQRRGRPGRKPKAAAVTVTTTTTTSTVSLPDDVASTIPLRLRLFRLLSNVSFYLPAAHGSPIAPVEELYEAFADRVRALPLPAYRALVASHHHHHHNAHVLPDDVQITFLRVLADSLLPPTAGRTRTRTQTKTQTQTRTRARENTVSAAAGSFRPDPADVDPDGLGASALGVTPLALQECFLPFAAARVTAEDNARLALALESMAWLVYLRAELGYSDALRRAVERGIQAREDKIRKRAAGGRGGGSSGGGEEDARERVAREALARSARNLRAWVDVLRRESEP
ncbi:hypothetical protein VTJ83DRAFT_2541 [Remersonia thermophila]|uniref:Uncharacterized protein n=1 Tax=Remersonia thermophila TaxID=72144 RepID=A0ABR4DJ76_9PEZI